MLNGGDQIEKLVAGGAIHTPIRVQVFIITENLLDIDRQTPFLTATFGDGIQASAQTQRITPRVGQPIDMIDTQAIDPATFDQ